MYKPVPFHNQAHLSIGASVKQVLGIYHPAEILSQERIGVKTETKAPVLRQVVGNAMHP